METFQKKNYAELGIDKSFVQDNHSHSSRGTLRGMHYQLKYPQAKLIYVITGEIYDAVVDIRRGSPSFGQWKGFSLSAEKKRQLFVPQGFAHGFCVLSETADVMYKCSDFYNPNDEFGILWSDPDIGINWPVENPILTEKDSHYQKLNNVPSTNLPVYQ